MPLAFKKYRKRLFVWDRHTICQGKSEYKYIQKGMNIAIEGAKGSGKTKELLKAYDKCFDIYKKEPVFIDATYSVTDWFKINEIPNITAQEKEGKIIKRILTYFEKKDLLIDKLKGRVLFIDNLERIVGKGKKLELIRDMLINAETFYITYESYSCLYPSIRRILDKKKKEIRIVKLSSGEAQDVTFMVIGLIVIILCFLYNRWEVIGLVMGARYLMRNNTY